MIIAILTLITSLAIAGIAAWYSITGLAAIFASAATAIMIMGAALEVGKLVTASWLYRNWRNTGFLLKTYLTTAVVVLMFITSMGIFGFLSKAHLDQTIQDGGINELQIASLERKIAVEQRSIGVSETVLSQLDQTVQTLINYDRIRGPDGAKAVRDSQKEERAELNKEINSAQARIDEMQAELIPLKKKTIALEAEVGPIKYIAELIYGDKETAAANFDSAVRWVIILIIFVFDPLAVLLLIAANQSLVQLREAKEDDDPEEQLKALLGDSTPEDFMVVEDEGVRVVNEENIYENPADKLFTATGEELADSFDPDYDIREMDEPEQFYEAPSDVEVEEVEVVEETEDSPGVVPRVPYSAAKGLIEESPGR